MFFSLDLYLWPTSLSGNWCFEPCVKIVIVKRFSKLLSIVVFINFRTHITPKLQARLAPSRSQSKIMKLWKISLEEKIRRILRSLHHNRIFWKLPNMQSKLKKSNFKNLVPGAGNCKLGSTNQRLKKNLKLTVADSN